MADLSKEEGELSDDDDVSAMRHANVASPQHHVQPPDRENVRENFLSFLQKKANDTTIFADKATAIIQKNPELISLSNKLSTKSTGTLRLAPPPPRPLMNASVGKKPSRSVRRRRNKHNVQVFRESDDSDTDFRDMLLEYSLVKSRLQELSGQNESNTQKEEIISIDSESDDEELSLRRAALKSAADKIKIPQVQKLRGLSVSRQLRTPRRHSFRSSSRRPSYCQTAANQRLHSHLTRHSRDGYAVRTELRIRSERVRQSVANANVKPNNLFIDLTSESTPVIPPKIVLEEDNYEPVAMDIESTPSPRCSPPIFSPLWPDTHHMKDVATDDNTVPYTSNMPTSIPLPSANFVTTAASSNACFPVTLPGQPCSLPPVLPCIPMINSMPPMQPSCRPYLPLHVYSNCPPPEPVWLPANHAPQPQPLFVHVGPMNMSSNTLPAPKPLPPKNRTNLIVVPLTDDPPSVSRSLQPADVSFNSTSLSVSDGNQSDNSVSIELGSPDTDHNSHPASAAAGNGDIDDDCDETETLLLRAKLLTDVTKKRKQQTTAAVAALAATACTTSAPSVVSNTLTTGPTSLLSTGTDPNNHANISVVISARQNSDASNVQFPKHNRVVISLPDESSSDEDDGNGKEKRCSGSAAGKGGSDFQSSLDKLLRDARFASSSATQVGHENSQQKPAAQPTPAVATATDKDSSSQPLIDKSDKAVQEEKAGNVKKAVNTDRLEVDKCMKKRMLLEQQVATEKQQLRDDEAGLMLTKLKLTRKKGQLRAAEIRAQKLREQLAAAETIINSNVKQLDGLNMKLVVAQRITDRRQQHLDSLHTELTETTRNLLRAKQRLLASTSNVKLIERNSASNVGELAKNSTSKVDQIVSEVDTSSGNVESGEKSLSASEMDEKGHLEELVSQYAALIEVYKVRRLQRLEQYKNAKNTASDDDCKKKTDGKCSAGSGGKKVERAMEEKERGSGNNVAVRSLAKVDGQQQQVDDDNSEHSSNYLTADKLQQLCEQHRQNLIQCSTPCITIHHSDPVLSFQLPVRILPPSILKSVCHIAAVAEPGHAFKPYRSSLRCLRSYRFCPYYRLKDGLSLASPTYSNALDCRKQLCQFDLMGKCLDSECRWQHRADYTLTHRRLLLDLVSYQPCLAGATDSTPADQYPQLIGQYVDGLLGQFAGKISHSEQCLAVLSRVSKSASCNVSLLTDARHWRPPATTKPAVCDSEDVGNILLENLAEWSKAAKMDREAIIDRQISRLRYFVPAENSSSSAAALPSTIEGWIKLAYKKLNEHEGEGTERLDSGLVVLAQAIEANQTSSLLWQHYIELFSQRPDTESEHTSYDKPDSKSELVSICEEALNYAPSYELLWKYLLLTPGFTQKIEVCRKMRRFLCSPMYQDDSPDLKSHRFVEVVFYQASLNLSTGHFDRAIQTLQSIVEPKPSVIWMSLTTVDRVLVWLTYLHLVGVRKMPGCLFDPTSSNPGAVVSKKPFCIPWQRANIDENLPHLLDSAVSNCDPDQNGLTDNSNAAENDYLSWLSALYRSQVSLILVKKGYNAACQSCEQVLKQRPGLVELWIYYIELIVLHSDDAKVSENIGSKVKCAIDSAIQTNSHSVELYLTAINAFLLLSDVDSALQYAEQLPISLFNVDPSDPNVDPNLLYSALLGQSLPPRYRCPCRCPSVPQCYLDRQQANLWLGFCLLLDLQGASEQAVEAYHNALCSVTATDDVRRVWLALLHRCCNVLSGSASWLPHCPAAVANDDEPDAMVCRQFAELSSLVRRALHSTPTHHVVLHRPEQHYQDYSAHNDIINVFAACLPLDQSLQLVYDSYLQQTPHNTPLASHISRLLFTSNYRSLARGYSILSLSVCPRSLSLWSIYLLAAEENVSEMCCAYRLATKHLPYCVELWRCRVLFEIIHSNRHCATSVANEARQFGLELSEFISSVLDSGGS